MIPRRRKPPLLEALGNPPTGRSGGRGLAHGPISGQPTVVHPGAAAGTSGTRPASLIEPRPSASGVPTGAAASAGSWFGADRAGASGHPARDRTTVILFLLATLVGLFAITWSLAYRLGHRSGQQSVLVHTDPKDAAAITGQVPIELPPTSGAPGPTGTVQPAPGVAPIGAGRASSGAMPPIVGPDLRKPGFNYLEVCLLTWRDAEPAVRFLQANGIRAAAVPAAKGVDPGNPQPNNRFLIIVDQPFASGKEYRNSQAQRDALKAEIRRLGKKWQTEHRGASDFHEPEFRLQKGTK